MKKEDKFRSRVFNLLLYPEDLTHMSALDSIKKTMDYACILHDKDYDDDGVLKKPHYHVIIRNGNAIWNTALAKDLGIEINYIEKARDLKNSLLYLIHFNDNNKYQYNVDEVQGNLKNRLIQAINDNEKSEGEKIVELIEYIKNYNGYITITDFASFCATNGYWSEFRRSGSIFVKIIDEHNERYREKAH